MSDLIRRQDVIDALELSLENDYVDVTEFLTFVKQLPSTEPERKKGKWSNYKDEHGCSVCHSVVIQENWDDDIRYDYCPYCGAKMRGEE